MISFSLKNKKIEPTSNEKEKNIKCICKEKIISFVIAIKFVSCKIVLVTRIDS